MEDTFTIRQVAEHLQLAYGTVFQHRHKWGFFKMEGSRVWRITYSDLEKLKKRSDNSRRLALSVDEEKLCRSEKEETSITLTSIPLAVKELDALLKRM